MQIENLVSLLESRATLAPDKPAYFFLGDGTNISDSLTYQQLAEKAKTVAGYLQSKRKRSERAILLYPSGLEFIIAFFGCLYAGIIAVPAYPPRPNRSLNRIKSIVKDAQPQILLTKQSVLANLEERVTEIEQLKSLHWCATDTLKDDLSNQWQKIPINGDNIAFLQYTSGTTGSPKGVIVSHENLLHNQKMIQRASEHDKTTIFLG